MKAINQLKTFIRILDEYPAETPLSKFLPGFYRQNKQMGSTDRKAIRWRTVAWGLGLQLVFAFLVLRFSFGQLVLEKAGGAINAMLAYTQAGTLMRIDPKRILATLSE